MNQKELFSLRQTLLKAAVLPKAAVNECEDVIHGKMKQLGECLTSACRFEKGSWS